MSSAPEPAADPEFFEVPSFGGYGGQPGEIIGAGFWIRAAARFLDLLCLFVLAMCSGILFAVVVFIVAALTGQSGAALIARGHGEGWIMAMGLTGEIAYHTIFEGLHGSTPGKLALGLVVIQEDGLPCRLRPAFIRSLAYFADTLFFGLIGYMAMKRTPQEQRNGDRWAGTIVCKRSAVNLGSLRSGKRFLLVLFLAGLAEISFVMIGQVLKLLT